MTVRPILFSDPMVRALLAGEKTQTRRLVTSLTRFGKITEFGPSDTAGYDWHFRDREARWHDLRHESLAAALRFGVGDLLWVREYFAIAPDGLPVFAADDFRRGQWDARDLYERGIKGKPSIHMPRAISRITLDVTQVRVQRLQDISAEDAEGEGIRKHGRIFGLSHADWDSGSTVSAAAAFANLWDHINGDGAWAANPWIVALTFDVHQQNIDAFVKSREAA